MKFIEDLLNDSSNHFGGDEREDPLFNLTTTTINPQKQHTKPQFFFGNNNKNLKPARFFAEKEPEQKKESNFNWRFPNNWGRKRERERENQFVSGEDCNNTQIYTSRPSILKDNW